MMYIMTIIYIFFTTFGLTLMKLGGDSLKIKFSNGLSFQIGWVTFCGFLCYLISFLLWQKMLVKYDLSVMVPIVTGIVQIVVLLIGNIVFKESLSLISIIGAILIIIGIVVMAFGNR